MLLTGKSALITGSISGIVGGAVDQDELVRKAAALIPGFIAHSVALLTDAMFPVSTYGPELRL